MWSWSKFNLLRVATPDIAELTSLLRSGAGGSERAEDPCSEEQRLGSQTEVAGALQVAIDMKDQYCLAVWSSHRRDLDRGSTKPCPEFIHLYRQPFGSKS